jgi:hypothetical protein
MKSFIDCESIKELEALIKSREELKKAVIRERAYFKSVEGVLAKIPIHIAERVFELGGKKLFIECLIEILSKHEGKTMADALEEAL